MRGLFVSYDETVAILYDLRLPRILVALLAGAALSAAGLLLQAALRNPLADPGMIGISGGAAFTMTLITAFVPSLFFAAPILACLGGFAAFALIYTLAWKGSLDPVRVLLVGVAIAAMFAGMSTALSGMNARAGVPVPAGGLTQLVWSDVRLLAVYTLLGLVAVLLLAPACDLLGLEDDTIRSLGVRVDHLRLLVSGVAVALSAATAAVIGVVGFLALLAPHMARRIVGNDHRMLIPLTMVLGAFSLLLADTAGRLLLAPVEIPASVLLNIFGAPFFILLLRREVSNRGA